MQVKVVIGTVAFMLTMIILGFAALLEPGRMERTTLAVFGRDVESGAFIFQSNCATCHGVEGDALACFDTGGDAVGCVGRPLNHPTLQCGEPSPRLTELAWQGTKRTLIYSTVAAGRPGSLMPPWSDQFGGPLNERQVNDVTEFVMNWESEELCPTTGEPPVGVEWPEDVAELPEGEAAGGEQLFTSLGCLGCHGDPRQPGSNLVGPHLGSIGNEAATRIEGTSAEQYIFDSILHPNEVIAPVCANNAPCGSPSQMPGNFGERLDEQGMADLIRYLMAQMGQ